MCFSSTHNWFILPFHDTISAPAGGVFPYILPFTKHLWQCCKEGLITLQVHQELPNGKKRKYKREQSYFYRRHMRKLSPEELPCGIASYVATVLWNNHRVHHVQQDMHAINLRGDTDHGRNDWFWMLPHHCISTFFSQLCWVAKCLIHQIFQHMLSRYTLSP